jgi:hypothetical protein
LNGKPVDETPSSLLRSTPRHQPDFDWKAGNLTFIRKLRRNAAPTGTGPPSKTSKKDNKNDTFSPFKGLGVTLKGDK